MMALDTNLLARLLLKDDAAQHARVKALLGTSQVFTAPVTVFLELVWVLEAHDIDRSDIVRGMHLLLGLPNFTPPEAPTVRQALSAYMQGLDFADALHLALSRSDQGLVTFDKSFARKASKLGLAPPVSAA